MSDSRTEKLAQLVTEYSLDVQPSEQVMISGSTATTPLMRALYKAILRAGGHPFLFASIPGVPEIFYQYATEAQLRHIPEPLKVAYETFEAGISIMGTTNTKALTNVPPEKIKVSRQARRDILNQLRQRMATREYKWLGTIFPTSANAQDAEMSLSAYEDFVYAACLPDEGDPIGYWKGFSAWQQKIVEWLRGKTSIHIKGPETDIRMTISGRAFRNCDGQENMPDGEVCVSPVETSAEGRVYFSYPGIFMAQQVQGVRLWFKDGQVIKASAEKGEGLLLEILETDEGARRLGELGIGTNHRITQFTGNTLFDEKISGTIHLALGAGLPYTGGQNQSAIHWDLVADLRESGEIWVDEILLYKDGGFAIDF